MDELHLAHYLFPRDCPRITLKAKPDSSGADIEKFLRGKGRVIFLETDWRERFEGAHLYLYEFSPENFISADHNAGYYVSRNSETPRSMDKLMDLPAEHRRLGTKLEFLENLWPIRDEIVASSLSFSAIRMRNAQPRA